MFLLVRLGFDNRWILGKILLSRGKRYYHFYSPEETVGRIQSCVGDESFGIGLQSSEEFSLCCRIGISEAHQLNKFLDILLWKKGLVC